MVPQVGQSPQHHRPDHQGSHEGCGSEDATFINLRHSPMSLGSEQLNYCNR